MAKYPYIVNKDGIWYKSGTEVPDTSNSALEKNKVENKSNTKPQTVSENADVRDEKIEYTKTDINRMPTSDLKKLAKENGLDESMSGAEIKKALIDKFEL